MLRTWLTDRLGIRYPVISASMTGVAYGRLARAVSQAGGLGMLGIGSQVPVGVTGPGGEDRRRRRRAAVRGGLDRVGASGPS
jgi:NAD(P)H-dependent flavin oxidoreductase YrpB (nitropropane dioxygenase family)